jgi:hypothetical protein
MAFPRVFISSTCYDLGEVRDSLYSFIKSLYYEPIVSEKGDIFYHPDYHTHESCVSEIENCNLFILIIGGRHGGSYVSDTSKSIVNAEYEAAKKLEIPVFTFIKKNVYDDHRVYQRNKRKSIIDEIDFPSIEKDQHAKYIFEFINEVRLSKVNNGFFEFEYAKDIIELLGKQLAGMMNEFLNQRDRVKNQQKTYNLIENLTLANRKTEELIENIYKKIDNTKANKVIENIDIEIEARKFLNDVLQFFHLSKFQEFQISAILKLDLNKMNFIDFVSSIPEIRIDTEVEDGKIIKMVWCEEGGVGYDIEEIDGKFRLLQDYFKEEEKSFNRGLETFKLLNKERKSKVLNNYR